MLPLAIKKQLEELKIISVLLFVSIFSFIAITCVQLGLDGVEKYNADYQEPRDFELFDKEYYFPTIDIKFVSGLSVILVAFGCQQNLFPIYSELKNKTQNELVGSFGMACASVLVLYVILSVIGIYMFGSDIARESTILKNVEEECTLHKDESCPWESIVLRFMFMIVIACHIPFLFFSGKEGTLIIVDEISRKSISRALEMKMKMMQEEEEVAGNQGIDKDIGDELRKISDNVEHDALLRYGKSEAIKQNNPSMSSEGSNFDTYQEQQVKS